MRLAVGPAAPIARAAAPRLLRNGPLHASPQGLTAARLVGGAPSRVAHPVRLVVRALTTCPAHAVTPFTHYDVPRLTHPRQTTADTLKDRPARTLYTLEPVAYHLPGMHTYTLTVTVGACAVWNDG